MFLSSFAALAAVGSRGFRASTCLLLLACAPADTGGPPTDPPTAAADLGRHLQLLADGATTLITDVEGIEVETRIALTPAARDATWADAVEAFDVVQPALGLSRAEQLALEYRFALVHRSFDDDDGCALAAELRDELAPHLTRIATPAVASR